MSSECIICVFGAGGVGKSCLTIQFVQEKFMPKYDPTIEDVYTKVLEVDEKQYSLQILDTAGSDEFSAMRDMYVTNGHGFVLVYSITSQATFNDLSGYYDRIINVKDIDTHGQPAIVLVGNKRDLESERAVSRETGQALAQKWKCTFLETSAKDRSSVTEIFYDIVRQINRKTPGSRQSKYTAKRPEQTEPTVQFQTDNSTSQSSVRTDSKKSRCCGLL